MELQEGTGAGSPPPPPPALGEGGSSLLTSKVGDVGGGLGVWLHVSVVLLEPWTRELDEVLGLLIFICGCDLSRGVGPERARDPFRDRLLCALGGAVLDPVSPLPLRAIRQSRLGAHPPTPMMVHLEDKNARPKHSGDKKIASNSGEHDVPMPPPWLEDVVIREAHRQYIPPRAPSRF